MQEVLRLSRENEIVDLGIDGKIVPLYKGVQGRAIDVVPKFVSNGRIWLSEAEVMEKRIERFAELPDWRSYFLCSDIFGYGSRKQGGKVKFVFMYDRSGNLTDDGRLILEYLKPETELVNGAIESDELYDGLKGVGEFSRDELGVLERELDRSETLDSLVWRIGARHPDEVDEEFAHDENLLEDYESHVRKTAKCDKNMGVYLDDAGDVAKLRAWYVDWLGGGSDALGGAYLASDGGCFAGKLAPEAQVKFEKIKIALSE